MYNALYQIMSQLAVQKFLCKIKIKNVSIEFCVAYVLEITDQSTSAEVENAA